jgi:RES domain
VNLPRAPAPRPAYRLIPSRFPPIGAFDTVATAADLEAVMELEGWTNDRLVAHRLARLPREEWVHGRANASVVLGAFLHVAAGGMRFNAGELGAWYAAAALATAAAEVGHHLRREAVDSRVATLTRDYRCYLSTLAGQHVDIRGRQAELPDAYAAAGYGPSQAFGESLRARGEAGILYDSLRHAGGVNVAAFRPSLVLDVIQADHYRIAVSAAARRIDVRLLVVPPPGGTQAARPARPARP